MRKIGLVDTKNETVTVDMGIEKPLTVEEAAEFLGVKKSTLYKMTHRREIPFSKPHGKMIYFSKVELVRWMLGKPVKTRSQIEDEVSNYVTLNNAK